MNESQYCPSKLLCSSDTGLLLEPRHSTITSNMAFTYYQLVYFSYLESSNTKGLTCQLINVIYRSSKSHSGFCMTLSKFLANNIPLSPRYRFRDSACITIALKK